MPTHKPIELLRIKQKLELNSPSLWWVSIQSNWFHCRLAFAPGSGDLHVCCCCWFRCSSTGKRFSNRKETSCLPLLDAGFEAGQSQTPIRQQASFGIWVLSLPASVWFHACLYESRACRRITRHPVKPVSPNLNKRCKTSWWKSMLFMGWLALIFKCKFDLKVQVYHILSLSAPQLLKLESPNLDQMCKHPG